METGVRNGKYTGKTQLLVQSGGELTMTLREWETRKGRNYFFIETTWKKLNDAGGAERVGLNVFEKSPAREHATNANV